MRRKCSQSFPLVVVLLILVGHHNLPITCSFVISSVVRIGNNRSSVDVSSRSLKAIQLKKRRKQKGREDNEDQKIAPSSLLEDDDQNVDAMRARAAKLRLSILKQQQQLQDMERQIVCCDQKPSDERNHPWWVRTISESSSVLLNRMNKSGQSVGEYAWSRGSTGVRIVSELVQNPSRLAQLIDPATPTLVPHVPAILARLDKLESHVAPILERVLNNRRHLASIEPYLDQVLDRFDDIEPHLAWILDNIDALAPYTGLLLKHIDELLVYAHSDDMDQEDQYTLARQLLPYLGYYVSRLDVIGPHLPLLRPHVPLLLRNNRIGKISPHIDRLFARGYKDLNASANLDILLFWFGWTLQVPGLPRFFFAVPGSPRLVSFLAKNMPKRFARRNYCHGVSCVVDNDYGANWNKLTSD